MPENADTFIDENFLRQLERIKIVSKKGIRGTDQGEHRARKSGEGLEFLDYRKYQSGDDLRYVDWSVYGRLDKLFIKLFHAEENQTVHILLDMSSSMAWGREPKSKNAKKIAAAIAYIALANLDKVGVAAFSDSILKVNPPRRSRYRYSEVVDFLNSVEPSGKTDINTCLMDYVSMNRNPGIMVIISDLFDERSFQDGLMALTSRNFDTHLIQILDHEEIYWSERGNLLLTELETGAKKQVFMDISMLESYREKVVGYISGIQDMCTKFGMSFYLYDTSVPFEDLILDYLTKGTLFK